MHLTSFLSLLIFIHSGSDFNMKYHFTGYTSISIYINILFVLNLILRKVLCIFLLNNIYSTVLTHLRQTRRIFRERSVKTPPRNFADGIRNFRALWKHPWAAQGIRKTSPQGYQYQHGTVWWLCLITTSSTSQNVVDTVLFNWKWHELTSTELKCQIVSLLCKKKNEWTDVPHHNQCHLISKFRIAHHKRHIKKTAAAHHWAAALAHHQIPCFMLSERPLWLYYWTSPLLKLVYPYNIGINR